MGLCWYHITWHTFGTWLPGDPRGFRSREHRIHSTGDYQNPPPASEHAGLLLHTVRRLSLEPVVLVPSVQQQVLLAIVEKARSADIRIVCLAVCTNHVHLLGEFDALNLSRDVGRLKRHSSHAVRAALPGQIWAEGLGSMVVRDHDQHLRAVAYILSHGQTENAKTWDVRDETHS